MAEQDRDVTQSYSVFIKYAGNRMAKPVDRTMRQSSVPFESVQNTINRAEIGVGFTQSVAHNKIGIFVISAAEQFGVVLLFLPFLFQRFDDEIAERYLSVAAERFGSCDDFCDLAPCAAAAFVDIQQLFVKIDIIPGQSAELTLSHAGVECQQKKQKNVTVMFLCVRKQL